MDSQARVKVCATLGLNGKKACPRCPQTGGQVRSQGETSTQYSASIVYPLRTNISFSERKDVAFHKDIYLRLRTALECMDVDMIKQIIIDIMHVCDAGVTKKYSCSYV